MGPGMISLGAGILIGLVYALLKVRSPAPPAIALVGLLGMLIGSQLSNAFISRSTDTPPHAAAQSARTSQVS